MQVKEENFKAMYYVIVQKYANCTIPNGENYTCYIYCYYGINFFYYYCTLSHVEQWLGNIFYLMNVNK